MLRLLLFFFWLFELAISQCPPKFELVSAGECRKKVTEYSHCLNSGLDSAITSCGKDNATLASIHNDEQFSYWKPESWQSVLGLTCNSATKRWEWVDKSPLDFKPANYDDALDEECVTGCTWYYGVDEGRNVWFLQCEEFSSYTNYLCAIQLPPPPQPPKGDNCEAFNEDDEEGRCYLVDKAENWKDASMTCASLGAELASIHNDEENSFVRRLAVSKGDVNGLFLGAKGWSDNFEWVDGSAWDYSNYYPGYPIYGFGDCLAMDTSTATGQWMNTNCKSKLPVVCARPKKPVPEPSCKAGALEEAGYLSSPGFPFSSSMPCDFFLEVDTQNDTPRKKVQVEILLLEANSCCDRLILYEGNLGGNVIANLTGSMTSGTYTTTSSNIMRVSWQPQGGVNVRGMAMFFRGV